jgi:hypothetical protein
MKVTSSELIYEKEQNYVRASIYADTTPGTMPKPEDIAGLDNTWKFTPDSMLYIVGTGDAYLAGEDNAWHKQ